MLFVNNKQKILVIDDDAGLRRQLSFRLEKRESLKVIEAENGQSGLTQANNQNPDLIILDWMLPDIQGPEVLNQLKNHDQTRMIPVLMLTGKNKIGDIEDAFDLGADAYLVKPFNLQDLAGKVNKLLNQSSKNDIQSYTI
ncbi:MAG: response regulator [Gammaproteobacteria bacterium]|nr:response regulator [Gammaproteobacteria bacterium]